jgi:hypothetical protein
MPSDSGRYLRDNVFLVAAVALPVVIVGLFLLTTAIPRWTVPPPAYDLLLRTSEYEHPNPALFVDFVVRDARLHASIRVAEPNSYAPRAKLWRFDRATMNTSEIALDLPRELGPGESTRMVPIDALAGRRVVTDARAPDGYELQNRTQRGTGVLGNLFGMGRYGESVALVNRGRVIPVRTSAPHSYQSPQFVGWLIDDGSR